jgi:Domain of unknown function (DUF397)
MLPVDLVWRKSSRSDTLHCVELACHESSNSIRDSKNPGQKLDVSNAALLWLLATVTRRSMTKEQVGVA